MPGGFWKRPTTRTYAYNLDLGEHYYHPMTNYLYTGRGVRDLFPGALTFNERLARQWIHGRRYGAASRASSIPPEAYGASAATFMARRASSRASSETRENLIRSRTPPFDPVVDPLNVSAFAGYKRTLLESADQLRAESARRQMSMASARRSADVSSEAVSARQASRALRESTAVSEAAEAAARSSQTSRVGRLVARQQQEAARQMQQHQVSRVQQSVMQREVRSQSVMAESRRRIEDDICKKVADVHMMPWSQGQELDEANSASMRARARIGELERELEDITRKALSAQTSQRRTAAQLAQAALAEEEAMASSQKKTRRVMVESSARIAA